MASRMSTRAPSMFHADEAEQRDDAVPSRGGRPRPVPHGDGAALEPRRRQAAVGGHFQQQLLAGQATVPPPVLPFPEEQTPRAGQRQRAGRP